MDTFQIIYTLLGGLGVFFYGMKMMSDSLQKAGSEVITNAINSLTSNRFLAVLVGIIVTMVVQSSSVTTVMVVGFVNAGLMQLTQAIGVILGSNIGTTITGWIISIKVGKYGLLFIGLGIFPIIFSKNTKLQTFGKLFFGIGMIFVGLNYMSGAFKPLRTDQDFLNMISYFSGQDYMSYFASILTGCLLTVIIQSSSAMLGITMALATSGIIQFPTAAALVLGENIGTTITALLASVGTTTNAKRAARAHAFFNVFGVILVFLFLPYYVEFIDMLVDGDPNILDAEGNAPNIATHIAASHTFFNITATLAFLPFLGYLAKFVIKITPEAEHEKKQLVLVGDVADIVPATAIVQAESEVKKMHSILERMYKETRRYLIKPNSKSLAKVGDYEQVTDNMQKEVTVFLCKVMERSLSEHQSLKSHGLIKIVDEMESIADYLERVVGYKSKLKLAGNGENSSLEEFDKFFSDVWTFYEHCVSSYISDAQLDMDSLRRESEKLRVWADDIRDRHIERVSNGEYDSLSALTFSDMVVAVRKVRAHAMNAAEAIEMFKSEES